MTREKQILNMKRFSILIETKTNEAQKERKKKSQTHNYNTYNKIEYTYRDIEIIKHANLEC